MIRKEGVHWKIHISFSVHIYFLKSIHYTWIRPVQTDFMESEKPTNQQKFLTLCPPVILQMIVSFILYL